MKTAMVSPSSRRIALDLLLLAGLALCASVLRADTHPAVPQILVGAGKSYLIDTPTNIARVSIAAPEVAEAVPVNSRTLVVNGKTAGETSLIVWLDNGTRQEYNLNVGMAASRMQAALRQTEEEFGGKVQLKVDNTSVYLTGTVRNLFQSQRAVAIAETLGKVVNLLNVEVPPQEVQILLHVRFANVDRTKSKDLGINFLGAPKNFPFSVKTGAYPSGSLSSSANATTLTLSDALNLLFFDPQINVGATLKDLESKAILQILAEPNLLAMNGHEASFVAGGEFPYPNLQGGGSGIGQVTVQFRPFGVQIHFLPTITPRGTIRLHLSPEVSSLDYSNALTVQGSTVPAFNTRKVETDIELESGQTFAIAGLLDQRATESLSRIPGLANLPVLGKLFTSKTITASNSELLIIVTPEFVAPVSDPAKVPDMQRPLKFLQGDDVPTEAPRTPGAAVTGPPALQAPRREIPVQEMQKFELDQSRQASPVSLPPPAMPPADGSSGLGGASYPNSPTAGAGPTAGAVAPPAPLRLNK